MKQRFNPSTEMTERALRYFHRIDSYIMLGSVAIELGRSIEIAETVVLRLVESGDVRKLTIDELRLHGLRVDSFAYRLVNRASIARSSPVND